MIDLYTKAVLTVIAIALIVIVIKHAPSSVAAAAFTDCGDMYTPCYMKIVR